MGFEETQQHKQQQQQQRQPAPLSRTTENRAGPRSAEQLPLKSQRKMTNQRELKPPARDGAAAAPAPSGAATKRRLRPMELKQQQRQQREQRKRAKLSLPSSLSSSFSSAVEPAAEALTTVPQPSHELAVAAFDSPCARALENGGNDDGQAAGGAASIGFRDSRVGAGVAGGGGKEPLRRSSSSPPSIGSARR